jgi:hypothetical protein
MEEITKKTTKLVTRDEAFEGLTARIKELEVIKRKGGMRVPKMRDVDRRLRTAKAELRRLAPATEKPRKRRSAGSVASYHQRVAALRVRDNS